MNLDQLQNSSYPPILNQSSSSSSSSSSSGEHSNVDQRVDLVGQQTIGDNPKEPFVSVDLEGRVFVWDDEEWELIEEMAAQSPLYSDETKQSAATGKQEIDDNAWDREEFNFCEDEDVQYIGGAPCVGIRQPEEIDLEDTRNLVSLINDYTNLLIQNPKNRRLAEIASSIDQKMMDLHREIIEEGPEKLAAEVDWEAFKKRVSLIKNLDLNDLDNASIGGPIQDLEHIRIIKNRCEKIYKNQRGLNKDSLIRDLARPLEQKAYLLQRVCFPPNPELERNSPVDPILSQVADSLREGRYGSHIKKAFLLSSLKTPNWKVLALIDTLGQEGPFEAIRRMPWPLSKERKKNIYEALRPYTSQEGVLKLMRILSVKTSAGGKERNLGVEAESAYSALNEAYKQKSRLESFQAHVIDSLLDSPDVNKENCIEVWRDKIAPFIEHNLQSLQRAGDASEVKYETLRHFQHSAHHLGQDILKLCDWQYLEKLFGEKKDLCKLLVPELAGVSDQDAFEILLLVEMFKGNKLPSRQSKMPWIIPTSTQRGIHAAIQNSSLKSGFVSLLEGDKISDELLQVLKEGLSVQNGNISISTARKTSDLVVGPILNVETVQALPEPVVQKVSADKEWVEKTWWPDTKPSLAKKITGYLRGERSNQSKEALKQELNDLFDNIKMTKHKSWKDALFPQLLEDLVGSIEEPYLQNEFRLLLIPEMAIRDKDKAIEWIKAAHKHNHSNGNPRLIIELLDAILLASGLEWKLLDNVIFGTLVSHKEDRLPILDSDFTALYFEAMKLVPSHAFSACFDRWIACVRGLKESPHRPYKAFASALTKQIPDAILAAAVFEDPLDEGKGRTIRYGFLNQCIFQLGSDFPEVINKVTNLIQASLQAESNEEPIFYTSLERVGFVGVRSIAAVIGGSFEQAKQSAKEVGVALQKSGQDVVDPFLASIAGDVLKAIDYVAGREDLDEKEGRLKVLVDVAIDYARCIKDPIKCFNLGLGLMHQVKDIPAFQERVLLELMEMVRILRPLTRNGACNHILEFAIEWGIEIPQEMLSQMEDIQEATKIGQMKPAVALSKIRDLYLEDQQLALRDLLAEAKKKFPNEVRLVEQELQRVSNRLEGIDTFDHEEEMSEVPTELEEEIATQIIDEEIPTQPDGDTQDKKRQRVEE